MSLEIKNISKKYKSQIALSNICFSLKKGPIRIYINGNSEGKVQTAKAE